MCFSHIRSLRSVSSFGIGLYFLNGIDEILTLEISFVNRLGNRL
jgi:hypothetical protein